MSLSYNALTLNHTPQKFNGEILSWQDGKYILADGIFTEVLSKKGNIYTVKKINNEKVFYLATNGKNIHAHGDTIVAAKEDLRFKKISEKLKHTPITPNTIINMSYYRVITGACNEGMSQWMAENKISKESMTAKELLPILRKTQAYGFEKFEKLITF